MAKWMLIYVMIANGEPMVVNAMGPRQTFDWMYECFTARDKLSDNVGGVNGYFPKGKQAVCIQLDQ